MSANVETMFYVREKPWHGLGTMVQEAPTSADALRLAGLDWTVEARDMWLNGGYEPIPGYKANVRSSETTRCWVWSVTSTALCRTRMHLPSRMP